jgi:hypothetical protein
MHKLTLLALAAALAITGLTITGLTTAGAAHADDGKKVDCGDTDLGFKDPDFDVDCEDLSESAINLDDGLAGAKTKKLFALRKTGGVAFIVAVDTSVLGARVYMKREGLREQISGIFTKVTISDWASANNASGFETATFDGSFESGADLQCRAFRRDMNRRYEGVGRRVLGITCTSQGDAEALATLAKLDAAGD